MTETSQTPADELCIPNIGPRERLRRLVSGVIPFAVGLLILAALLLTGSSRWWRLVLFPFFVVATSGFFQWRDKT